MAEADASSALNASSGDSIEITFTHHSKPIAMSFPQDATIADLSERVSTTLSIPPSHQKFLIAGKLGLQKPPFKDPTLALTSFATKKITLMGSTQEARLQEEAQYTFHTLRPLPYLPHPERSLAFLERLRSDAGIKAAMRTHKFSVPLLTEMDPAMHTTQDSRTLGLNRNKGEVIELRLRTDAYDGYRDYKTIRKTLCHELAHCVWGPHDRNFWDLCGKIEKEVLRDDWRGGGRRVGEEEVYDPGEDGDVCDHGGWTGGEFTLGSAAVGGGNGVSSTTGGVGDGGLSRREVLARAAEERMKRTKKAEEETGE
ncbi:WLM domain containing protein [Pyrenophora tritici-repentis]|nr:WLM domain-containing protein [Pyrenophora tritici-repentis]KAI1528619.1 WLM domain containing protein [Pyrenophora tritici-repentis]KAI1539145.1 WLM domain containing protein [Pyrenophora tritici-repentis]KAI1583484.1 WLM domain containing protein [Pyrenophora tritici-repentis]PZD24595.1 WLM domain containing protein [Pyrenophora tritici-repentis]